MLSTARLLWSRASSSTALVSRTASFQASSSSSSSATSAAAPVDHGPVPLSYISYEDRANKDKNVETEKNGKAVGSPLVIHHSLLGCRKNWLTVAKVWRHF